MGAHQKIDRAARRHLSKLPGNYADQFPGIKEILRFEGKNGPDGIKRKSPSHNEPWHFLDPFAADNSGFLAILEQHYKELATHLAAGNKERAAFEAAWLAHAAVDGLTPAHHYPYDDKIVELQGTSTPAARDTVSKKLLFKGDTHSATLRNTAKVYGPKGLLTAHAMFEMGVTLLIRPLRLPDAVPGKPDFKELKAKGYQGYFMNRAREVASLGLYDVYLKSGWSPKLSNQVRHNLAPIMVRTVTVLWYAAAQEAAA